MEALTQSIIVGVSGKGENAEAVSFAAQEAKLRGVGVTLAHAVHDARHGSASARARMSDISLKRVDQFLDEERDKLSVLTDGEVAVTTVVRHGKPGVVLAELSEGAVLVVLQHRDLSRLHRIATGSTVTTAAAHAECLVVSVPPRHDIPSSAVVTVGIHEDGGPAAVLDVACAEAAIHGWDIRLVHAWNVASAYGDMVAEEGQWTSQAEAGINAAIVGVHDKYPDLKIDVDVRHDWPADVLTRMSKESELLVVGRHGHHGLLQPRLGSLARAAIVHAECPVMIVPL